MGLLMKLSAAIEAFRNPHRVYGAAATNGYCPQPRCILEYGHAGTCDWV